VALLDVQSLRTVFTTDEGAFAAVDDLSFQIDRDSTMGLVGESGCGKSVSALSILRLVPSPPGKIESGEIKLDGINLLDLPESEMRKIRGNRISMIFQEPTSSLNPVFTIGNQVAEAVRLHQGVGRKEARDRAVEMLKLVKIPEPERRAQSYPHQLSGGMCQRAMIAMALACRPDVLIADEPTTALDVTIQAQILDLIAELRGDLKMAVLLITHDLGIVAQNVDRVLVMYAGAEMEEADVEELFANPRNPYTKGLLESLPRVEARGGKLPAIPGTVPSLSELPAGCRFRDRCPEAFDKCSEEEPPLVDVGGGHFCRCWRCG